MDNGCPSTRRQNARNVVRPLSSPNRLGAISPPVRIFEHQESAADCLRLLFGKLPASKTGSAAPSSENRNIPISPHYARLLADLARERGFDGYLLNFEWHLQADGGVGHARALAAWIALLQAELKSKVGAHAEVIWSVYPVSIACPLLTFIQVR